MVDVEEGKAFDGSGEDDEESVKEFEEFGEVEDVGPEEEGAGGRVVGREADGGAEGGGVGEDGKGGGDGHCEGEEGESEVVEGGEGFEEGRWERGEREEEEESEGEIKEDGKREELEGGEWGVGRVPCEVKDFRMGD